VGIKCHDPH
jgi:DNA polymerase theta